jgi:crotonobetainyl-CoA:carnitine CoA-transferase CaiB-like acyl-CoA transferase
MPGALNGLRVIDFGQYMAGPMAAMLLGDHGADVIRIDPPGGPRWDTPANATWNRNKRSIVLNLKKRNDRKIAKDLIASADILIENFRPGVMDRLGLGHEKMMKANRRLIYCSLPGFGSDDPRANVRAWEGVVGAATSTYKPNPEAGTGRPIYTAIPFGSAYAAFLTAVSVAFALTARSRSGTGQRIEMPLFDATFTAMGARGMKVHRHPEVPAAFNWSRQAECKDGRWVMYVANNMRHPEFLKATGADQWIAANLSPQELTQKVGDLFKSKTALEWEAFCEKIGTECVTCHTSAEWLEHPQALATGIIGEFEDPVLGKFKGPGINARLSDTPGSVRRPRPTPDQHREEILRELAAGASPASLPGGEPALRAAMQGVKVLDLCIILAGPACGRTLAEFGADVIKIDDPRRNPLRFHFDVNRGKRSVLLDLKTDEGREILYKLIDQCDVVLQNYRKDAAVRLGIGYEQVKQRKPSIVYASLNTFGQTGPFAGRPGHEQIGQAVSGMQLRYGGHRPLTQPFPANDYGTGLSGAYAVALALLEARRTGRGQHVDTALAYTATMLQSGLITGYAGKQWNEPRGQDVLGSGPLHRAYQAADGWVFVGARPQDLKGSPDLGDLAGLSGSALEQALETRMKKRNVADWVILLNNSGIGAHAVVENSEKLMQDLLVVSRGMSITRDHPVAGPVTTTGPSPKLSGTPLIPGHPSTKPGSDAESVLAEIGMAGELERLKSAGVIVTEGIDAGE